MGSQIALFLGTSLSMGKKIDTALFEHFTSGGIYLEKVCQNKDIFIGKFVKKEPRLNDLLQLEANVKSLLKKIFNEERDVVLIPLLI